MGQKYMANARPYDERLNMPNLLPVTPVIGRAVANPVVLWLMRSYLGQDSLHYCHTPGVTIMRPARKLREKPYVGGWHSDYPYPAHGGHGGHGTKEQFAKLDAALTDAGFPSWQDRQSRLGVQFNICVT